MSKIIQYIVVGVSLAWIYKFWKCYLYPLHYHAYPELLPDPTKVAGSPDGITSTCNGNAFAHVKIVHNVHDMVTARKIAQRTKAPVLFKNFITDIDKKWDDIMGHHKDTEIDFTNMEIQSFGNTFLSGAKKSGTVHANVGDVLSMTEQNTSLFASFTSFLDESSIPMLTGDVSKHNMHFLLDSNFISNFHDDVVSTEFHAAFGVRSYAFQFLGSKLWVFMHPRDTEKYLTIVTPATMPIGGNEKQFFADIDEIPFAKSERGDLLVFPNHWQHAVLSTRGPNVMFNLRELTLLEALWTQPGRMVQAMLTLGYLKLSGAGNRDLEDARFTYNRLNPLEQAYADRRKNFVSTSASDSACKDFFVSIMRNTEYTPSRN
eukprot:CAMPEP_0185019912 /NCGR_PEP_ID=MMETSP1103-20130426/2501_1 /TAXON_ID=36769 /ORGANISM="Paraphysomonas bandaiensis, Strain Caron Lab Isolate" /LENGTH=373 /DNA_ID=CAMNT_0027550477 /DNA_START=141 /DNA_END=1262 /DNA_ORIENTATION=-